MKAGYICANPYTDPRAWATGFTPARGLYGADVGRQTLAHALEQARAADSLGFDFVTVSEHHGTPMMCTPNASILAGALTQIVKQAAIAWLGPIVSINNPVRVAEEIAMLDQLTGGRLIVAGCDAEAASAALRVGDESRFGAVRRAKPLRAGHLGSSPSARVSPRRTRSVRSSLPPRRSVLSRPTSAPASARSNSAARRAR
jgi:alkanesulfonate monooxygenase SsuD/methylene tetrahydromethanopterin reductase-like flavin-dependent oxidoreductase (luciferase family)